MARFVIVLFTIAVTLSVVTAQRKGEYITSDEMTMVQDMRRVDSRAKVFLKIADRRLIAIETPNAEPDDTRFVKFGPFPKGSQIELLDDYRRAIEELMAKLDDEYERTGMSAELKKALEYTHTEIERQMKVLDALGPKLSQPDSKRFLDRAKDAAAALDEGTTEALKK